MCSCGGAVKILAINPFSGSDFYACDRAAIVSAVADVLRTGGEGVANFDLEP